LSDSEEGEEDRDEEDREEDSDGEGEVEVEVTADVMAMGEGMATREGWVNGMDGGTTRVDQKASMKLVMTPKKDDEWEVKCCNKLVIVECACMCEVKNRKWANLLVYISCCCLML
jgi:hypothetical protein